LEVLYTDLSLDFADNRTLKTIKIKQHDSEGQVIRISLFYNGQRVNIDSSTDTATLNASVGGTVTAYNAECGIVNNQVRVVIDEDLTTVAGTEHCEIKVSYILGTAGDPPSVIHTATFDLLVEPSVANTDHQSILANTDLALNWAAELADINALDTTQNTRLSNVESDISAINTLNTTQNTRLSDIESVNTIQNTNITNINNTLTTWDTAISNIVEYVTNIRFDISTELDLTTDPNNPVKPFIRISRTGTVPKDAILFCKNSYAALSSFGIEENASPAETTYIYYDKIQQYSSSATGTWAFVADTVNQCFAMRKLNVSPSNDDRLRSTDWVIFVLHLQHSTGKIYAGNKIIYSNNVYIDGELQSITDTSSVIGLKNSWFCLKSNPYNPNVQGSPERAIMKIISATGNTHYRFLISNTQNITDFVTVCIFSDNTYTRLDTKNVSSDGSSFFVDVTTSENAAYLRFNAKIGSNGTVGSLTLTEFTGDSHSIEGRVTALENREVGTNKTIGIIDSWFCLKSNPGENVQARMKEFEVEPSTHYRFLINNTKNISKINTVCLFNTYDSEHPNDYTVLDRHTVTADGSSFFIDVDTPSNGAILLFNALMPSSGVGSFMLTQFSSETATIDGRVRALENREVGTNKTTCKIFKKVVCCGDSYTAGYIDIHGSGESQTEGTNYSETNEDYSWVHYMATMTGNNWVNCGASGANVWTWQTKTRGLPAARTAGKAQAYIIGLMINDTAPATDTAHHVDLGTPSDIGTENNTYYAGLSKIIRELNEISPTAKIFVNTCPKTSSVYTGYNTAVRTIVETYKNTYPVHCIDLANHSDLYSNSSLTGDYINGHYTAIGYEQFAEIYALLLSDYINTHISEFQDVAFIPITNPTTNGNGE
jgi:hypothetical protein